MRSPLLRALVCCTLVFGACDGGSKSDPLGEPAATNGSGLTKTALITEIDAICTGARDLLEGLEAPGNLEEAAKFLRKVLPVIRDQAGEVKALGDPPSQDQDVYLEWLSAREGIVETTALMIKAAEERDRNEFERHAILQSDLDSRADTAAQKYGFEVCGSSDEPGTAPTSGQ